MKMNLEELRNGVVHADGPMSNDYTLCDITTENTLESRNEYTDLEISRESETEPYFAPTKAKIDCEVCARIIRYCCKLGTKSIKKEK
jgi:hypothetical protein